MKKLNLFLALTILAIFMVFANSCKKDNENDSNNPTPNATVTDIDGNVYHTVTIGTQTWMVENLKTTKYRNGDLIGTTIPSTFDISNETSPKYQWAYNGNDSNVATYGRLYTWYAITDNRNICPTGWHIPSDADWTTLTNYLGGETISGGKLKESGTTHWQIPNTGATNSSGFTALPGGFRSPDGTFYSIGIAGSWWCSTVSTSDTISAYLRIMEYNKNIISSMIYIRTDGFSVRCIKD